MKYISELKELDGKVYSSVEELEKAEEAVNTALAEKKAASLARKADSDIVTAAIIDRVKSQKKARDLKREAYEEYLRVCDEVDELLDNSKRAEQEALLAFCKKYPDGFHEKITVDGATFDYSYATTSTDTISGHELFKRLFSFDNWFFDF